ncbi:TolC family protein [Zhouia amylolytica]|uniref:Outer membrane efflux protein n=1 Tax=Zhouia amylolytica AD3 TaxID=1286632 RepID=W2UKP7_9FLAO|nr:TolC family protein [Zhouia amylolytica]ETN93892.1 outer membrane efflux protein [Zhouia amylolytica AD3]
MSIKKSILLLTVFVTTSLTAQEVLTPEEAMKLTLENNLGIQIANNNLEIAENNADILNSGFLPVLSGNASGSIDRQNTEGELGDGSTRSADGVETRRYNASLNLNYTLFDGLGRHYNYKSLKEQYGLSELEARQTIESTIVQLFTVYYEVARIEENNGNLKQALEISKDRLKRIKYQFDYGQATGLDVLNAEVDVNTDSINVLNSDQLLRNTKRDLNLVINRDLDAGFTVDTTVTFTSGLLMEEMFNDAKSNNVQMLIMEKNISISNYDYKAVKSGFLPTIGLSGSYGWNEASNNNPLAFTVQNTSTGLSGGVSLAWDLFDGGRTITNTKNLKINYANQELIKRQTELQVERNIKNAWETYQNALFIYDTQEKNVLTTKNNFDRTEERYKIGQATSLEFRQAQINLLNAVLAKNQAKYTAKIAELIALQVSGQLLNTDF